jgi:hypothetical protein
MHGSPVQLEVFLSDILRDSGVDVLVPSSRIDAGTDLAVWDDGLDKSVGNPLVIELKSRIAGKQAVSKALKQLGACVENSNSKWGLLVYLDGPDSGSRLWDIAPRNVLHLGLRDLLTQLETHSFNEIVRNLRNRRVHEVTS